MKKNVLFFSPTFYDLPLNENIKKKYDNLSEVANVTVLAFSSQKKIHTESETTFYLNKKNKSRIFNYLKIFFVSYFQIPKLISQYQIEIVTFQDPVTSFLGVYKIKKKYKDVKIVIESHGDFINTLELEKNLTFPNLYKNLFSRMASYTINCADMLRAVSSSTEEQALSFNPSKRVVRFPAWIDFEIFSNIEPMRDGSGKFKILFIGSVTDRKKPHMIIDALPELINDQVELNIVGPTPNQNYLESLKEKIKSKNVEDRVFIHGNKNRDEVKKFYSENNLMILPSVSEGLARVIFESQVTACPVLVTDAPGMQDIVIDGQTGYVFESNNLDSMIKKINHVIQNYNEATSVGINAKEFILSNYSSDNFKFSFQKIFDTV